MHGISDIYIPIVVHIGSCSNKPRRRLAYYIIHDVYSISYVNITIPVCITFYDIYWYILRVLKCIKQAYLSTKG